MLELQVNSLCMREISWQATDQGCQGRIAKMKSSPHTYGCLYSKQYCPSQHSSNHLFPLYIYLYIYEYFVLLYAIFVGIMFALLHQKTSLAEVLFLQSAILPRAQKVKYLC